MSLTQDLQLVQGIPVLGPIGRKAGRGAATILYPVKTVHTALQQRYEAVEKAAHKWRINPVLLWGVYGAETSHGSNVTTSSAGAKGGFQFIAPTAKAYNYPYTNAQDSATFAKQADAAAHYLHDLLPGGKGEAGLKPGHAWEAAWESALRKYSGGGYGLALVKQRGAGAKTLVANQAANEKETQQTNNPSETSLLGGIAKIVLEAVLLLAGAVLVVYGIMVAVRPRDRALTLPRPAFA